MAKRGLSLAAPPGLPPAPRLHVARAKVGPEQDYILTDAHLLGIDTHWLSTHTYPCWQDVAECEGCRRGRNKIWKGYSVAFSLATRTWSIIEVTQETIWSEPLLWADDVDLRGARLTVWRAGKAHNAPVRGKLKLHEMKGVPASPVDCLESLIRLWFSRYRPVSEAQVKALRAATFTLPPGDAGGDQVEGGEE